MWRKKSHIELARAFERLGKADQKEKSVFESITLTKYSGVNWISPSFREDVLFCLSVYMTFRFSLKLKQT